MGGEIAQMVGEAQQSDKIMAEARRSLAFQREGGRRRQPPIGRGSAELRQQNLRTRIKLIAGSMAAIVVAAMVVGVIINGIGFGGIMTAFLAIVAATFVFSNFPKVRVPKRAELNTGDVRHMVARTELWLESQRPALPPPAVTLVDKIGTQLDALGLQMMETWQKTREEVIVRQQQEITELSTPVVKLWQGILALPLIGTLDADRTQVVMEHLLDRIVQYEAEFAIIDISEVPVIEDRVAQQMLKTVAARPYSVSLARRTASSSVLNGKTSATGPKNSSRATAASCGRPTSTVGR